MEIPPLMSDLALILISASVTTIIFKWLKQPVILGYILAGFLVGKQVDIVPTVANVGDVTHWSDIGVVFLLFALGLEFSFKKLISVGKSALVSSLIIILGMILTGFLVGLALGWGYVNSIMLGSMICMSSTTIIIKSFDDLDLSRKKFARLVFGILIFEDLIAILLMVIVSTMSVSKSVEGFELVYAIAKLVFFLVSWLVFGIFFIPILLKKVKRVLNDETMLIVALGFCFGMVIFATKVGFSSALGAFVMGSIFAETVEAERIENLIKPLKNLFGAIFFVSVGMLIDVNVVVEYFFPIIIISLAIIIGQIIFATSGVLLSGESLKTSIQSSFSLTQVGEFAFIIALLGTNLGLIDKFIYPVIVAVSVLTIFITPFMMKLAEPTYNKIIEKLPKNWLIYFEKNSVSKTVREDSVWVRLLKQIFFIICLYSILVIAVMALSIYYIIPFSESFFGGQFGRLVGVAVSIIMMSPLIRALVAKKNHSKEYKYLLACNRSNWIPLVSLTFIRVLLGIGMISFLLITTFNQVAVVFIFIIASVLIFIMMMSKVLKMHSIKLERRFMLNLSLKDIEKDKAELKPSFFCKDGIEKSLSAYDLHLADFEISPDSSCCGKNLIFLDFRRRFGVHIVSIIRGHSRINIPGGKEMLFPFDKVLALGTDEQLCMLEKVLNDGVDADFEFDDAVHSEVSIEQIEIDKNSDLIGRSIIESGIRDKAKCLVVGIERDYNVLMNPDVKTLFQVGDIVWLAGEKDRIKSLMKSDSISVVEGK